VREEVGHWLPKCSGLLTPVGSDETFQAKILFAVHFLVSGSKSDEGNDRALKIKIGGRDRCICPRNQLLVSAARSLLEFFFFFEEIKRESPLI
jgi:hypothetical protein